MFEGPPSRNPMGVMTKLPVLFQLAGGLRTSETLPFDLAIALDISGSMGGERISCAKAAVQKVVDSLRTGDRLHLVTYHSRADLVFTNGSGENRDELRRRIDNVGVLGGTNLESGLRMCADVLAASLGPRDSRAVFVFSDGETNEGLTSPKGLEALVVDRLVSQQVAVHAFGIGPSYREESLFGLSRVGNGGAYHIRGSDDIGGVVEKGLRGLSGMIVRDATLSLRGCGPCCVLGFRSSSETKDSESESALPAYSSRVRALRAGGLVQLLADVDVRLPGDWSSEPMEVARWSLTGPDGSTVASGSVRVECVDEPSEIGAANAEVGAFLAMREAVRLEAEAKRALDSGDVSGGVAIKQKTVEMLRKAPQSAFLFNDAFANEVEVSTNVIATRGYGHDERKAAAAHEEREDSDGDMGFGLFD
eukprot:TRINITY_DN6504_c0_g1_i2.p1 TRINITY_DN6504_c0_g1~~TRINITY_DN6504_c0_g1_i2.p1  ORF type:complete len:420 (-),score=138.99 TRINITY_DN6504_c0_g1_i2:279-1538(-)